MQIDSTIHKANALVIDSNANARSLITSQLREIGVGAVRSVLRVRDARLVLENAPYDLVICDYHFDGSDESGQDLLDELRREQLLPYSTVFMMVTAEATYAKVSEAAEAALDGYLVKPYTLAALAERVQSARYRKRVLKDIFEAIEAQEFEKAAELCLERFEKRKEFWLFAARIGAELLLRIHRHEEAKKMYEAIMAAKTVPWAKLGVARSEFAAGNLSSARRTLESLIGESPSHADSYDVLGRVHMEQGDLAAALATYRQATELTPGCLLRLQRAGTLSFYGGEREEALRLLERSIASGLKSKLFDAFSLVLVALMRFDKRDHKGVKHVHEALLRMMERNPEAQRLRRIELMVLGLMALQDRKPGDALKPAQELASTLELEDADHEVASLALALWVRLDAAEPKPELPSLVERVGMRYCVSKASTELLVGMIEGRQDLEDLLRNSHAQVFEIAETAMKHAMRGNARVSVEMLIQRGEDSRNAKLIDMAMSVLKRHAEKIESAGELEPRIAALQARWVKPVGGSAVGRTRSAGGVALRG
ncbi:CheY-like chemotaxis protein [Inhella inkyongensis]|uniref:CheY-like chemotaxis protein n=1 Tax=Inhella inkyongensis TaxID=392593 RepID=A0A840S6A4_9BURK|nr:response regulator [Inhella inkyongensis]MBB5205955.1 CheY-like chemotaxis protein [Inhella inkyongensis]